MHSGVIHCRILFRVNVRAKFNACHRNKNRPCLRFRTMKLKSGGSFKNYMDYWFSPVDNEGQSQESAIIVILSAIIQYLPNYLTSFISTELNQYIRLSIIILVNRIILQKLMLNFISQCMYIHKNIRGQCVIL